MDICEISKSKPSLNLWEDITHKVKAQVHLLEGKMLVYLQDEKECIIGLWDAKGFYSMVSALEVRYKIYPAFKSASRITWFKVYRKKEK